MAKEKRIRKTKTELEALKQLAQTWFMNTDKSQKEIADIIGVSEVTLSAWAGDGRWAELKAFENASRGGAVRNILKQIFQESQSDKCDADKIAKLSSALERLEQKKITVPNIINIFMDFGKWLYPKNAQMAKDLTKLMNEFVMEKAGE